MQLGHQAANCTTGTINWKSIYGDDAFRLKIPLYESDYVRIKKEKEIDFKALEERAREYAKVRIVMAMPFPDTFLGRVIKAIQQFPIQLSNDLQPC